MSEFVLKAKITPEEQARIDSVVAKARAQDSHKTIDPSFKSTDRVKGCIECGRNFVQTHGNQKRCPTCRLGETDPRPKEETPSKVVEKAEVKVPEARKETYPSLEFEGFRVSYDEPVPAPMARPMRSAWLPFLLEFMASSAETACLAVGDSKKAGSIRDVLKNQIERQGLVDRVRAKKRKTSVYLVKRSSEYWEG